MIDSSTYWTIAYRKPKANRFQRATDLATDWEAASLIGRQASKAHPGLQVWVITTRAAELAGYTSAEDAGNILNDQNKRIRVVDTGSLASLGLVV